MTKILITVCISIMITGCATTAQTSFVTGAVVGAVATQQLRPPVLVSRPLLCMTHYHRDWRGFVYPRTVCR